MPVRKNILNGENSRLGITQDNINESKTGINFLEMKQKEKKLEKNEQVQVVSCENILSSLICI